MPALGLSDTTKGYVQVSEGQKIGVIGAQGTVRCAIVPAVDRWSVVALYQYNERDVEYPLGVIHSCYGLRLQLSFTLLPDTVAVAWKQEGRYYVQAAPGIPREKGLLIYPPQLDKPQRVEFA